MDILFNTISTGYILENNCKIKNNLRSGKLKTRSILAETAFRCRASCANRDVPSGVADVAGDVRDERGEDHRAELAGRGAVPSDAAAGQVHQPTALVSLHDDTRLGVGRLRGGDADGQPAVHRWPATHQGAQARLGFLFFLNLINNSFNWLSWGQY